MGSLSQCLLGFIHPNWRRLCPPTVLAKSGGSTSRFSSDYSKVYPFVAILVEPAVNRSRALPNCLDPLVETKLFFVLLLLLLFFFFSSSSFLLLLFFFLFYSFFGNHMTSRGSNGSNEHGPLGYFFEGLGVLTNEIRCIDPTLHWINATAHH